MKIGIGKIVSFGLCAAALCGAGLLLTSAGGAERSSGSGPAPRGKITVTIYDRGNVPASEGTIENNRWTRWINENGPVDVTFVAIPRVRPEDKINTLFASGSAPDLIMEYAPGVKTTLYQQGMLMPVDEMIEKYSTVYKAFLATNPGLRKASLMPDGKLYHFGKTNEIYPLRSVVIRQDWLDKLGLKMPDTVEDLYQTAKAFAEKDPDGNGVRDTFGMAASYRARETINQMFQSFTSWVEMNNELVYSWDQIQARLEFLKRLYDENIIDRDFLSDSNGSKAMQDFVNGKVGILPWLIGWQSFTVKEYATLKQNVPAARLAIMPYPRTRWGRFNPTLQNPVQLTGFVNADCKDPQSVMKYIDFISGDKAYLALQFGTEGVHYRMNGKLPEIIDQEKRAREVVWAADFQMLIPYEVKARFASPTDNFDLSKPLEKEGYDLYKASFKVYTDTSVPYPEITHSEHMPQLPAELSIIGANINTSDFYDKAVVSGAEYGVAQALRDAKAAWEKGGGKQIEDWYRNWWRTQRNNAFLAKDIYDIVKQQDKYNKLP
jgi:putative aldouronate transport system substrate-binding protein